MAHASGPIAGNVIPGEFTHKSSGVHYKIQEAGGHVWLEFDRDGPDAIHGKRELLYFIGSGHRGRTYLFEDDGFYFEAPVNWYGQKKIWDMTPAYQDARRIPLNLPLEGSCVACHISVPQNPARGTQSKYQAPLMTQEGIGCERCHGPGELHSEGRGGIVNPAKLPAERREAVCMQCHLEGNAAVQQPGRQLNDFRPGDDLQVYVHYFVLTGAARNLRAASQFEALAESACKRKSGNALTCTTCHDAHFAPSEKEKTSYYNAKCDTCHMKSGAKESKHFAAERNCIGCHMPRVASVDVAHTQATDHRILRRPEAGEAATSGQTAVELRRFPATQSEPDARDLALAWQTLAGGGMEAASAPAEKYLKLAVKASPDDPALLTALGFFYQRQNKLGMARELQEQALQKDPFNTVAATDLGVIAAKGGNLQEAERLWRGAFERQPGNSAIGLNLCKALYGEGKLQEARETIDRVLRFNPDLPEAERLLEQVSRAQH